MITNLDHQLGRLFGRLMTDGLWDNTIIVYTTDHGEQLGDYNDVHKNSFFEGPANIPMIWRFPKQYNLPPGRVSSALVELADLLPTFCEITGTAVPGDITGRSMLPLIQESVLSIRSSLHCQIDSQHMFHTGKYKYLYFTEDGSELLFNMHASRRDEVSLAKNEKLIAPIRKQFIEHLRKEGNLHLVDGKLLNLQRTKSPLNVLRAQNPLGWAPAGR